MHPQYIKIWQAIRQQRTPEQHRLDRELTQECEDKYGWTSSVDNSGPFDSETLATLQKVDQEMEYMLVDVKLHEAMYGLDVARQGALKRLLRVVGKREGRDLRQKA